MDRDFWMDFGLGIDWRCAWVERSIDFYTGNLCDGCDCGVGGKLFCDFDVGRMGAIDPKCDRSRLQQHNDSNISG